MVDEPDQYVFAYGPLLHPDVQRATFGRVLEGEPDNLPGYRLHHQELAHPGVIALTGTSVHPLVRPTGDPRDRVFGRLLLLTEEEIDAIDQQELAAYRRVRANLASGRAAWVYVGA